MSKTSLARRWHGMPVAAALLLAACSDATGPLSPAFEPEVASPADNFQFQATGVTGVTTTLSYPWTNTGPRATVNHSTVTTGGSAQLTVRDAAGAIVYDKGLVASLNEPTAAGGAGSWTVQLRLTNFRGTLNFRLQRAN